MHFTPHLRRRDHTGQPEGGPSLVTFIFFTGLLIAGILQAVRHGLHHDNGLFSPLILIIFGSVGILWNLFLRVVQPKSPEQAAREMMDQQQALFGGPMEYRILTRADLRSYDLRYYDQMQQRLEKLGFRCVGDIESVTATRVFPEMRTFLRTMLSRDGTISAAIYDVKMRGRMRLLQLLGVVARDMRTVDFESELTTGTFVVTSNSLETDLTTGYPRIRRHQYTRRTPPEESFEHHRRHLQEALAAKSGAQVVVMRNLDDVIQMSHREHAVKCAHKRSMGFLNEAELKSIVQKDQLSENEQAVARELNRLASAAKSQAPPPTEPQSDTGGSR